MNLTNLLILKVMTLGTRQLIPRALLVPKPSSNPTQIKGACPKELYATIPENSVE
jgi:hypothetical protein